MKSLEEVHEKIRSKKRERSEIVAMFREELEHNERHKQIVEEMKKLRAEKKTIENQVYSSSSNDLEKMELLKFDIKSDQDMLSDIAINMYTEGKTVEIVDDHNQRWVPNFSVRFTKDSEMVEEKPKVEVAGGALSIEPF